MKVPGCHTALHIEEDFLTVCDEPWKVWKLLQSFYVLVFFIFFT